MDRGCYVQHLWVLFVTISDEVWESEADTTRGGAHRSYGGYGGYVGFSISVRPKSRGQTEWETTMMAESIADCTQLFETGAINVVVNAEGSWITMMSVSFPESEDGVAQRFLCFAAQNFLSCNDEVFA
ncbi:unnamed protein product [Vicia faba]|uniref:Uncharacterized protein n=1 Tax=Vicia faba TaxID=3906 RepID=A0AAV1ABH8_VICFA|nr:unnamed protein product [Vicia faba]